MAADGPAMTTMTVARGVVPRVVVALLGTGLLLPAPASAQSSAEQVANLNAQRAAHGIPAGIVERPDWSEACRKHEAYQEQNGGELTHDEDPSRPGYTEDGAWAGSNSVLTGTPTAFNDTGNAFEHAPIHLMQTLAPPLSEMGVSGGCATTFPGYNRPGGPVLFSYPGNGTTGHYFEETARELPFVPGDFVGLPEGTTTGPHLYVMSLGTPRGRLTGAVMAGPSGAVEVRTVDNSTEELGSYLPPGGIVIPVRPLAPRQTYTATASFAPDDGSPPLSLQWSFSTRGLPPLSALQVGQGSLAAGSESPAPLSARVIRLSDNTQVVTTQLTNGQTWRPILPAATYVACFDQPPSGPYDGASECTENFEIRETFPAKLEVLRAGIRDGRLDVLADVTARADGDKVQVEFHARGQKHRFTATVRERRLRIDKKLPRSQRSARSGIVTLTYAGGEYKGSQIRPTQVRLRAASGKARLSRGNLAIVNGVLSADGTVSKRARGVVRLQLTWDDFNGGVGEWEGRATIKNGRWSVEEELPPEARGGGYLTMQFTGYMRRNMRGEQTAKQVLAE